MDQFIPVIPKVCSAEHCGSARLTPVIRQSLYKSIFWYLRRLRRALKFFKWSAQHKSWEPLVQTFKLIKTVKTKNKTNTFIYSNMPYCKRINSYEPNIFDDSELFNNVWKTNFLFPHFDISFLSLSISFLLMKQTEKSIFIFLHLIPLMILQTGVTCSPERSLTEQLLRRTNSIKISENKLEKSWVRAKS